jgi:alpha-1,2-mannosyltransferase
MHHTPTDLSNDSSFKRRVGICVALLLAGMVVIEAANSIRIWSEPVANRRFPFDYVSRGVWSAAAFIRGPEDYTMDSAGFLRSGHCVFNGDPDLYREYRPNGGMVYPPTAAVLILPYALFIRWAGLATATGLLDITGRLCVLVSLILSASLLPGIRGRWRYWLVALIVLAAFYPLRWALIGVQVQSLITLMLIGAIIAYGRSQSVLAGILAGLASCLKPQTALLILFGLVRKEWRFTTAMCLTGTILVAVSLAMIGLSPWEDYIFRVIPVHSIGFAFYPNQSVNGLLHRWLGHPAGLEYLPDTLTVRVGTILSSIAFAVLAAWPRPAPRTAPGSRPAETSDGPGTPLPGQSNVFLPRSLDISIATLAATMAMPTAWEHHYAWSIVLFCLCLAAARQASLSTGFLGVLAISYLLIGTYIKPFESLSSGPASLLNSLGFAGGLLLLVAAWYACRQLRRHPSSTIGKPPVDLAGSASLNRCHGNRPTTRAAATGC